MNKEHHPIHSGESKPEKITSQETHAERMLGKNIETFKQELESSIDTTEKEIAQKLAQSPEDFTKLSHTMNSLREQASRSFKNLSLALTAVFSIHAAAQEQHNTDYSIPQEKEQTSITQSWQETSQTEQSTPTREISPLEIAQAQENESEIHYEYESSFDEKIGSVEITKISEYTIEQSYAELSDEEKKSFDEQTHGMRDQFVKEKQEQKYEKKTITILDLSQEHRYAIKDLQVREGTMLLTMQSKHALYDNRELAKDILAELIHEGKMQALETQDQIKITFLDAKGKELYSTRASKGGPLFPKTIQAQEVFSQ